MIPKPVPIKLARDDITRVHALRAKHNGYVRFADPRQELREGLSCSILGRITQQGKLAKTFEPRWKATRIRDLSGAVESGGKILEGWERFCKCNEVG